MAEKQPYKVGEGLPAEILKWKQHIAVNNERLAKFQRIFIGDGKLSEDEENEKNVVIASNEDLKKKIANAEQELAKPPPAVR